MKNPFRSVEYVEDNTPGALAGELAAAQAYYEDRRDDVLERGAKRQSELTALVTEATREIDELEAVITSA